MDALNIDTLGVALVEKGFAPNLAILDINNSLSVPHGFDLRAPWNLPSRMFRFPIEVCRPDDDQPRTLGLRHPLLGDHPYVRHVEARMGSEIDRNGAPNRHGYSTAPTARWWHAVDLIMAGNWRELLATRAFTEPHCIMQAVAFGCRYSHHEDKKASGYISIADARKVMHAVGAKEPGERSATIRAFSNPSLCRQEKGAEQWPINSGRLSAETVAWGMIFGIEDGWFRHDRAGFLQWSELRRERYAAGDSASYVQASGQAAFAF
ncbi:hypothetical protein [Sinorhizobium medicae]|uniref:hypothetical protein n=1 Tax=Sinorhizobium medicae TaxID=110321 RepID=UPI002AF6B1D7|nr:hypothetical protein [Sinorhizobium medicae]WQO48720.1 hypothetical protein U8C42_28555 [Sinorhizobium medicae]WQO68877.1 hypothetical protein U8C40_29100 [Sinorhizobium medicae]WQO77648.1 hypothetical protein U8C31_37785 [Sinorhizobium medicae]